MELAALLVAVHGAELGEAERQVTVRTGSAAENLAVMGAVHGFEHVLLPFLRGMNGLERILAVFGIVARGNVEFLAADVGSDHGQIPHLGLLDAEEILQDVAHHGAAGQPERQTQADAGGEGKQLHLLAQLTVVALLGLFQHLEILVQHALLGEGYAVDTGELLAVLVALPVCTGDGGQLNCLNIIDMLDVRTAAEVGKTTVLVECDGTVFQVVDEFHLVGVALLGKVLKGVRLGDLAALESFFGACQFDHLVFDLLEIGLADLPVPQVHVVVESCLYGRAYAEFHARIQGLESFGHKVSG